MVRHVKAMCAAAVCAVLLPRPGIAQPAPKPARPDTLIPGGQGGDFRVKAEVQEYGKGHYRAEGSVDLEIGDARILADRVDVYETEKDGTTTRTLVAEGNVTFAKGDERMSGAHLTMDLATGHATLESARGFVQPGVFVEAKTIERLDGDTYRIHGGKFTSCYQPKPWWRFSASSATLDVDDSIEARNVLFKVYGVPVIYLPWFMYPIQEDQRQTGFLMPSFGYEGFRGFGVSTGFFWAMGRSFDQTVTFDNYSKYGYGFAHEFRYAREAPSNGLFRTGLFKPKEGDTWDREVEWRAQQKLPLGFRATLSARRNSRTITYTQRQDDLNRASFRSSFASLLVQRTFGGQNLQLAADSNETFFGETSSQLRERLPSFRLSTSPKRIGKTGIVFSYDIRAERLGLGDEVSTDRYTRFDVAPQASRSFSSSFLQVTPRVQLRYTRYGAQVVAGEGFVESPLERPYAEGSVEFRGPTFSRVFNNPSGLYSEKFKHVIGPEVTWTYRTAVDEFENILKFDDVDQRLGTHQIDYGLVQRFLAKRAGPSGKQVPYEFLTWRIVQTYYVNIKNAQNEFDPNYSTAVFGPGGVPDHNSPILSSLRFRPSPKMSANFNLQYDVNFDQLRSLDVGGGANFERVAFNANWSRAIQTAQRIERRLPIRDTLRGNARLNLFPSRLTLDGSVDYNFIDKTFLSYSAKAQLDLQCCGVTFGILRRPFIDEGLGFVWGIQLANIGALGTAADPSMAGLDGGAGFMGKR